MSQASLRATTLLREQILAGRWEAGERLGEAELAEILQVSRTPVREALSRLAAEGLVEIAPNRGARIASWTPQQVAEIFDLRLLLEPVASGKAAGRLSAETIDTLEQLAESMQELGSAEGERDFGRIATLNRQFHTTLLEASDSPQLLATLTSVTHISIATRNYNVYTERSLARSLAHHFEIVAALRVGDGEWVEAVVRSHLHNARAAMLTPPQGVETTAIGQDITNVLV
ncbi:GntR family transcriptional regulator [Nocardia speluncae]|uniref:GntR family transcriptional regulator n=1 Tax=Nocardia speluncae TaxID=419477 RepID=A0A846X7G3_9NOCA|nr:GntR family transcriptional regulator [Nocardia speluncae]NKY31868.1 GntR family transcriptional regulator [Nocardia speluncae]